MTWRSRLEVSVELGLRGQAAGQMQWDVSSWDDAGATWSGLEPVFVPLSAAELELLNVRRGRDVGYRRHSAGTAELRLAWAAPGGRWSFRPTSPVELGQELRVRARLLEGPGEWIPIYRGAVRAIRDAWEVDGPFRVTLRMVDRLADLGAVNLPERPLEGLGDMTEGRIERILGLAEIPTFYAELEAGAVEHQSSNFARNLLDEAFTTVESELGADLLVDRSGVIVLRRPLWYLAPELPGTPDPRSNVTRLRWTNQPPADPIDVGPTAFGTGQQLDDVVNQVSLARAGGAAVTVSDADSIGRYGLRTTQRFDLTARFDVDVAARADYTLGELAERTDRVDEVRAELDPQAAGETLEAMIDLELGDQHEIRWHDGAGIMSGVFHVQSVSHQVTAERWHVGVNLWAYSGLGLVPESVWGGGAWGSSRWQ